MRSWVVSLSSGRRGERAVEMSTGKGAEVLRMNDGDAIRERRYVVHERER